MRKILAIVFVIFGVGIITTGVVLQLNTEKEKETNEKQEEKEITKLNIVNSYNLKDTCTTYNKIPAFVYFTDFTKVSFNYPDCVHEYDLNHWMKQLRDDPHDDKIAITITKEKNDPQTILKQKKTLLIGWKNEGMYDEVEYSDILEKTFNNGITAHLFQYNYKMDLITRVASSGKWYVVIEVNENNSLMLDIATDDYMMSQKAIFDIIESIKIEKVDSINNSKVEGNYQIGTIRQNSYNKYGHGYSVTYKVNNKYPEITATTTNINGAVFGYEDISKEIYVAYEMETDYRTTLEEAQSYKKVTEQKETETNRNIKNGNIIQKEINGKEIIYFINSYDYYLDNKKTSTYYTSYVYHEIEPNLFLKIYISNKNHEINEAFISEFLDFTVEEY